MSGVDREMLTNFMESKIGYAPAGGEMVGILKTMNVGMTADFKDATNSENAASASFDELIATKTKEIDALTASIASPRQLAVEVPLPHIQYIDRIVQKTVEVPLIQDIDSAVDVVALPTQIILAPRMYRVSEESFVNYLVFLPVWLLAVVRRLKKSLPCVDSHVFIC